MALAGGCRCGAVRYEVEVERVAHHAVCHCVECRRSSGTPATAWLALPAEDFRVTEGEARCWEGDGGSLRFFCPTCGTGLYFVNEAMLPGLVDIQSATLDQPDEAPLPSVQIQCADRLGYMETLRDLPAFARWPEG